MQTLASCASKSDGETSGSEGFKNRTLFVATIGVSFLEAKAITASLYSFSLFSERNLFEFLINQFCPLE